VSMNSEPEKKSGTSICVVTPWIALHDVLRESSSSMVALAQRLALAGHEVTLLWALADPQKVQDKKETIEYFAQTYSIKLEIFQHAEANAPQYDTPEFRAFGVYSFLKQHRFETVYFPLEHGLAFYALLGKETGTYKDRPRLVVVAHSPIEWMSESDRFFFENLNQVRFAFMEKYCAEQADKLICASADLLRWFKDKKWSLADDCQVLPALSPIEWSKIPVPDESFGRVPTREIVLIASPRFRDGITLFCDMLDELGKIKTRDFRVTVVGEFGKILGEHTGGMLVRRGRRWNFPLRMMPNLTLLEGLHYTKQTNGIAVFPGFASATGHCVSECIRLGIPFVASAVGGNVEHVAPESMNKCLAEPTAAALASTLAKAIETSPIVSPRWEDDAKERLWTDTAAGDSGIEAPLEEETEKPRPLVSIIVTHHDRPQTLLQAIDSLRDQDYPNFEVILVDDGSELAESHVALDRLEEDFQKRGWRIIRAENRYVGAARNTGVRAARGDLIIFLDDDNAFFPHAVSTYVAALEHSQADICTALSQNFHGANVPGSSRLTYEFYLPIGSCLDVGLVMNPFGETSSIYRRSVFDQVGFQLEKRGYMTEDYEFFTRVALAGLKLRVIPEFLYWYRVSLSGRYRSSHPYDNAIQIMKAFAKHDFKGVEYLYNLYLGQNSPLYHTAHFLINLQYNPSDDKYVNLTEVDPNSADAIGRLARIAASENREDTAISLMAHSNLVDFADVADILDTPAPPVAAITAAAASLTVDRRLEYGDLMLLESWTNAAADAHPLSYVEKPNRFFLQSDKGELSVAVLAAACPASTVSVLSVVSLQQAESAPAEFLVLLAPMHSDPVVAASSALKDRRDGSSGWVNVAAPFKPTAIEARLTLPAAAPMNLILAVRSLPPEKKSVLGCFAGTIVRTSIEDRVARRPRLGPPPNTQRARSWTNAERNAAKLAVNYESDLPLLLFPAELEGGLFIRPSVKGPVVAAIHEGFPAFAREIWGKVEIAHDEASSFEFAMALTLPHQTPDWRAAGPRNSVAFSGWVRVDDKFKLHDLKLRLREQIPTPLTISLAVRLPRGSNPMPASTFWRSIAFFWDE
jgi:glycosyltransferase involved in cell wall biosynthesis